MVNFPVYDMEIAVGIEKPTNPGFVSFYNDESGILT